ncbi:MAG: 3-methyl-2-oxobutanoate hydroxymethyltransferase [Promethearchaeota archaeon]
MNVDEIRALKGKRKIAMLTGYDCQIAKILDEVGIDIILVGDSLGQVVQGYEDTKSVTLEDVLYHTRAVSRGAEKTLIVSDMPIHTYDNPEEALDNAHRFLKAGAHAVKLEGNHREVISTLIKDKIPVMGHIGLLPQTAERFQVKGKTPEQADKLWRDSLELDKLGVFSIVVECVPEWLARKITVDVKAPTIGIGAGKYCDGQVLVINDLLGLDNSPPPKFVKRFANLKEEIKVAVQQYIEEVKSGSYPDSKHTYH